MARMPCNCKLCYNLRTLIIKLIVEKEMGGDNWKKQGRIFLNYSNVRNIIGNQP